MDKQTIKLIAELELSIQALEAGRGAREVISKLENAIQAIMDEAKLEDLSWFDQAQLLCHGRVL